MMIILEERVDKIIAQNEQVVKSYAQVVKDAAEGTVHTVTLQSVTAITPVVKLLDEYADRERRKKNLNIRNIPESEAQDLPGSYRKL